MLKSLAVFIFCWHLPSFIHAFEVVESAIVPQDWELPSEWKTRHLKTYYYSDFGLEWKPDRTHHSSMPSIDAIKHVAIDAVGREMVVIDLEHGIWALECCPGFEYYDSTVDSNKNLVALENRTYVLEHLRRFNREAAKVAGVPPTKSGWWNTPPIPENFEYMRQLVGSEPWKVWVSWQKEIANDQKDLLDFCVISGYPENPNIDGQLRGYADGKAVCDYVYEIPTVLYIWWMQGQSQAQPQISWVDHATFREILRWAERHLDQQDYLAIWMDHLETTCGDEMRKSWAITEPDRVKNMQENPSTRWMIENRDTHQVRDHHASQWIKEFESLLIRNGQFSEQVDR